MIQNAKQRNQELTREEILNESFIGFVDEVREKIKRAEELGVKKMVVTVRGGPSVQYPLELFHDKIMQ